MYRSYVLVCGGTGCTSSNSPKIIEELHKEIRNFGLEKEVHVVKTGCFGLCALGPIMIVYPEGAFYSRVEPCQVREIVEEHLLKGRIVKKYLYQETIVGDSIKNLNHTNFYEKQTRIALRNCGVVHAEDIDEAIARDGYKALEKVLTSMTPQQVIDEIKASGLRGRGGAGFPTGMKWEFTAKAAGDIKYVCCNADEGDPGAFMDRSVLEGDPHTIIEAMTIAAYAIGASKGFVYVRAEYPIAVQRLKLAIDAARAYGLLGDNIMGTGFAFDIEIRLGAGAFVCGEETALMTSIEGKRGEPRPRPPFPANKGLFAKPTVLNNVETLANIPGILRNGPEWFRDLGIGDAAGTKVFALSGRVQNTGLVEVPVGIPLREVVYGIGGGAPEGHQIKAVQIGGPSGGCIPDEYLDVPTDYSKLQELGAMMGSGGMVVMDERS
ncbi:MAG: NADH-quinone oxidoreductase subunit F, partial [Clostridiales bacterium]|nr:NADH-quinone oxidoreductase subunit F [Clostridiales bacterium]